MTDVYIGSQLVGRFQKSAHYYAFDYADNYSAFPISASMPLAKRHYENKKVGAWLGNLIPESSAVLADLQRMYRIPDLSNPLKILEAIGRDTPGALSFYPDGVAPDPSGSLEEVSEDDVAQEIRRIRTLRRGSYSRISLAGAQPKTSYRVDSNGRWYKPTGAYASTHILKPAPIGHDDENIDYIEHAMAVCAHLLHLPVVKTGIWDVGGERVFVAERYDRIRDRDGNVIRLHQEDLMQVLGRDHSRKYQTDSGPNVSDLIRKVRELNPSSEQTVWEILAFDIAIGNADAHGKNWSFLIDPSGHHLSPAYDLLSLRPFPQYNQKLAMSIGGQYDYEKVGMSEWKKETQRAGAQPDMVHDAVERINDELPRALEEALGSINEDIPQFESIRQLIGTPHS